MGTYRQPSQLIDKSLGAVSESISEIGSSITKQLQARREAQMKLAKEAKEKQQRETQREANDYSSCRKKSNGC